MLITNTIFSNYLNCFIENTTGVPKALYETIINQTAVVALIAVAAHMRLPQPVAESKRQVPDPIRLYKAGLQIGLDIIGYGLKAKIPEMLKNKSVIPWATVFAVMRTLWYHPSTQTAKIIIFPRMLHGKKAFYRDPVVEPNWESLRTRIITAIQFIEKYREKLLVATAAKIPRISAKIAGFLGAPPGVVAFVLKLMANDPFMKNLSAFRRRLEAMHIVDMPEVDDLRAVKYLHVPQSKEEEKPKEPPRVIEVEEVSPYELLQSNTTPAPQLLPESRVPMEDTSPSALITGGFFAVKPTKKEDDDLDPYSVLGINAKAGTHQSLGIDPLG